MSDRGRAFRVEAMHRVVQHAIGIGNALMLQLAIESGIDVECLDEGPLLRGVLIYAPITGGVAPALARALHYRREKMRRDRPTPSVFLESDVCICIGCVMDTPRVRMRSSCTQARPRRTSDR